MNILWMLEPTGRTNVLNCSIMLVETYYRSTTQRILEYILWVISGDPKVSLGMCQVRAQYWETINGKNVFMRIASFKRIFSMIHNYDAITSYFSLHNITDKHKVSDIACIYNGKNTSKSYVRLLKLAYSFVEIHFSNRTAQ